MGFKDLIKRKYTVYQKEKKERKGYEKILAEKTKLARRQAFAKEAVKQAGEAAKARAKQRYNPPGQKQSLGAAFDNFVGVEPKTLIRSKVKRKLGSKIRKTTNKRTATIRRRARQRTRQSIRTPRKQTIRVAKAPSTSDILKQMVD